jgi:hypothetical protein
MLDDIVSTAETYQDSLNSLHDSTIAYNQALD